MLFRFRRPPVGLAFAALASTSGDDAVAARAHARVVERAQEIEAAIAAKQWKAAILLFGVADIAANRPAQADVAAVRAALEMFLHAAMKSDRTRVVASRLHGCTAVARFVERAAERGDFSSALATLLDHAGHCSSVPAFQKAAATFVRRAF